MARKFILHIGPPKTGTSSLQEALFQHRGQLLKQGYDYPVFGRDAKKPKLPGHHGISDLLRRQSVLSQGVLDNLALVGAKQTVILSSENFTLLDSPQIAVLIEALQPAEVEVIYYMRKWDQLLPSVWQEIVKHGYGRSYLDMLNQHVSTPMASQYLNYQIVLDRWAQVVGTSNIRIFSYDNIRATGQDIVQHFCNQVLQVSLETQTTWSANPAQKPGQIETLRQLNNLYFRSNTHSPKVRNHLQQYQAKAAEELERLELIYQPYVAKALLCAPCVFEHVERQVLKNYGANIENLSEEGGLFQDDSIRLSTYVRPEYWMEPGVPELFRRVLSKLEL